MRTFMLLSMPDAFEAPLSITKMRAHAVGGLEERVVAGDGALLVLDAEQVEPEKGEPEKGMRTIYAADHLSAHVPRAVAGAEGVVDAGCV